MKTLGQYLVERRKQLGLAGREVVAGVRNPDGKPISIPYLVDLEHDRRKPSDEVLKQLAKVLKVDSDMLYFLAGRVPSDLTAESIKSADGTVTDGITGEWDAAGEFRWGGVIRLRPASFLFPPLLVTSSVAGGAPVRPLVFLSRRRYALAAGKIG